MALAAIAANSLDHIKGALLQFDYGAWKTGGAAPDAGFQFGGWIDTDFEVEPILERTMIEPGNCFYPTDGFVTKQGWKVRGTLLEAALDKLLVVAGGLPSSAAWAAGVGGPNVVSGVATLPLTQITSQNYWQVRLGVKGQSFKSKLLGTPSGAESTDTYTVRVMTLWRCTFTPRGAIKYSRTELYKLPFELDCFYDTTVTESATVGALGQIVDSVADIVLSGA